MSGFLKQSAAAYVTLGPAVSKADGVTRLTGLTIASSAVLLIKGGQTAGAKSDASALSHLSAGNYKCRLASADVATLGSLRIDPQHASAMPFYSEVTVLPANVYDSLVAGSDVIHVDLTHVLGVAQTVGFNGINSALSTVDGIVDSILADTSAAASWRPRQTFSTDRRGR